MKKLLCLTLVLCFVLSFFVGCKKDGGEDLGGTSEGEQNFSEVGFYEQGVKATYGDNGVDYILNFNQERDVRILQLADLQLLDLDNARNETRWAQLYWTFFSQGVTDRQKRVWNYVDEAVERAHPDLIVLTGDNIYGETDDDGSDWIELCNKMDSFKIPWLVVFGNHDNESAKGVMWQIERLKASKYCVFNKGSVTGNSNYSVLIAQNGIAKYLFYMLDSNGCTSIPTNLGEGVMPDNIDYDKLQHNAGVYRDQVEWFIDSYVLAKERYGKLPVMMFFHVPPIDTFYSQNNSDAIVFGEYFNDGTNFGIYKENMGGFNVGSVFFLSAKLVNCKGMFVGHQHKVATSIVTDGVRITYGLKTGVDAYHDKDMLGSTLITLNEGENFSVEYIFSKLEYPLA